MKTPRNMFAALFTSAFLSSNLIGAFASADPPREFVVAVSPYLEKADREVVFREILSLGIEAGLPEDTILVIDGIHLEPIVTLSIPAGEVYRNNGNARARALAPGIAWLRSALGKEVPHSPEMANVLYVPQLLDLVSRHLRRPCSVVTIVLLGSPFYMDQDGVLTMLGGYVPSDQYLRLSSRQTVFGTADKPQALQGVTVHYAYLHECFDHAEHQTDVTRFWSLFIQRQQGILASFTASPAVVFRRVKDGVQDRILNATLDETDHELVMRRTKHVKVDASSTHTNNVSQVEAESSTSTKALAPPQPIDRMPEIETHVTEGALPADSTLLTSVIPDTIRAGKSGIAIAWSVNGQPSAGVDIDLYTRAPESPIELYYACKSAPWGSYLRDVQNATGKETETGSARDDWEYVELGPNVSVQDTSVWLDIYRNSGKKAIQGVIILVSAGHVYQETFVFPSGLSGDQGANRASRDGNPNWKRIDLARIFTHG